MPRRIAFTLMVIACVVELTGCGDGREKTLRRLGSSKSDSARLTSVGGEVAAADSAREPRRRAQSKVRIRVRER